MSRHCSTAHTPPSHRSIWQLAWPMMLSNLSIPLLGLVDTAILGHLPNAAYLGAVTLGASVLSLLLWSFGFLRMGTTSVAARATGAENHNGVRAVLAQSLLIGALLALLVMVLGPALLPLVLHWMNPSAEVFALALSYAQIRLLGAPASLMNYALVGWFIGRQDTRRPLAILFSINGLNIALDALLILGFGLNSDGAAWGSVMAEYGGLALGLWLAWRVLRDAPGQLDVPALKRFANYRELFNVNRHLFVRTLCLLSIFVFFAAQGAQMGNQVLAANAILLQFLLMTSYALDGFAHAAEALVGRATGAGAQRAFFGTVRRTGVWALLCAVLISAVFALGAPWWPGLFTDLPEVATLAREHFVWVCLVPLIGVWGYHFDGIFLGSGQTAAMQYTVLLSAGLFLLLWWPLSAWGNHGLWLAFLTFNALRGVLLGAVYVHFTRREYWFAAKTPQR